MRSPRLTLVALCLLVVPLGSGCPGPPVELTWESRVVERFEGNCDAGPEAPCARVHLEYPVFVSGADAQVIRSLDAAVRSWLVAVPGTAAPETPERVAESFLEEYRRTRREFPDAASTARWYLDRRVGVLFRRSDVVSLSCRHESFAGGAHGMESVEYECFDLRDGRRLTLGDLITEEDAPRLYALAEERFRRARGLSDDANLADAGFWFEGGFAVNDNFAIVEDGLLFHYNAYEVAPYAMGSTEILLPWKSIAPLLRPDGPLSTETGVR